MKKSTMLDSYSDKMSKYNDNSSDDIFDEDFIPHNYNDDEDGVKNTSEYKKRKPYLIYPDDTKKQYWDMVVTLALLISFVITPLNIAFAEE